MNRVTRAAVSRAFGSASDYDGNANVQRIVAEALADRIAAQPLPKSPRVLEIGCGTGFLTQALLDRGIGGEWLITDLSPAMLERCRARIGDAPDRTFAVLDGEYGTPDDGPFDLICSSLAMQWFDDERSAISRIMQWLAPGGQFLFTTLTSGSFAEWRAANEAEGLAAGTPHFLSAEALFAALPEAQAAPPQTAVYREHHDDARSFLHALKAIGAQAPAKDHRPLSPSELRRVMARFDEAGSTVTYEVVTCHFAR